MFVRRTQTRSTANGEPYFTHRLVCSVRSGARVRQRTLLNLGRHFALPQSSWPVLCSRVEQILTAQHALPLAELPRDLEQEAHRIAAQLLTRQVALPGADEAQHDAQEGDFYNIDVDTLELLRPRSVGVEQVALWAIEQVQLIPLLKRLGFNGRQRAAAVGSIIGRLAAPGSERATYRWLCRRSALGELLEVDFESMSMMQLYRVSDLLDAVRKPIEQHLFNQVTDLFGLQVTVTLYDLSNTYFEGVAAAQPLAQHGHSKEKRSDCPLLTLGLVVDGSGFVRRSEVMAGNIVEGDVLQGALRRLEVPARRADRDGLRGGDREKSQVAAAAGVSLSGGEPRAQAELRWHRGRVLADGEPAADTGAAGAERGWRRGAAVLLGCRSQIDQSGGSSVSRLDVVMGN